MYDYLLVCHKCIIYIHSTTITPTHIHTNTTYIYIQTYIYIYPCMHIHMNVYKRPYIPIHIRTYKHIHIHPITQTMHYTHMCINFKNTKLLTILSVLEHEYFISVMDSSYVTGEHIVFWEKVTWLITIHIEISQLESLKYVYISEFSDFINSMNFTIFGLFQ